MVKVSEVRKILKGLVRRLNVTHEGSHPVGMCETCYGVWLASRELIELIEKEQKEQKDGK